jgi:hypothetical protein
MGSSCIVLIIITCLSLVLHETTAPCPSINDPMQPLVMAIPANAFEPWEHFGEVMDGLDVEVQVESRSSKNETSLHVL